jgi:hypothetical protein
MSHAQSQLRLEMGGVLREDSLEPGGGGGKFTPAEGEHGVVILFLQGHAASQNIAPAG